MSEIEGRQSIGVVKVAAGALTGLVAAPAAFALLYVAAASIGGLVASPAHALGGLAWEMALGAVLTTPAFIVGFAPGWLWLHRRGRSGFLALGALGLGVGAVAPAIAGLATGSLSSAAPFVLLLGGAMATAGLAVRWVAYGAGAQPAAPPTA